MKKFLISTFMLMGCMSMGFAVEKTGGYKIDVIAPQLKNDTINLAMYFYGKIYSRDTVVLNSQGIGSFHKKKTLDEGIYILFFHKSKYFDLLIGDDQTFSVKIDTTDLMGKLQITGAEQSEKFNNYIKFLSEKRKESEKINKQFEGKKDDPKAKDALKILDSEVTSYQQNLINSFRNQMLGITIKALLPVEQPENLEAANDSILQIKRYYYNREHYFDNIDLSEPRLLRSNLLPQKIDFYVDKMLPQIPDTLNAEIVKLVEKSKGDTLTFQNMLGNMLNYAIKSKMMGMDKVVLTLSEKYYLSGQAKWADSTLLRDLEREVKKTKYNQVGDPAPNLYVETFEGKKINISDIKADYVLLFFFEPSCGHCKKETPKLHETVYQKYKANNFFEVFACYLQTDKKEWKEFLDKNNLYDWVNVWDPNRTSNFWYWYDTSVTPGLYLLNKERKIIAKKIDLETLDKILEHEQKKKK